MKTAELRVKLDKNINKLYRQLDKQGINNYDKIKVTLNSINKLTDGEGPSNDTEKLVKSLIVGPFGDKLAKLDVVGNLYGKAGSGDGHGLGIVLTPAMVTDLMCKLINVNENSRVLDLCCGAGAFPVSAIDHGAKNVLAIEAQPVMAKLAKENIKLAGGDPNSVHVADSFEYDDFDNFKADRILLNPPYSFYQKGQPFLKLGLDHLVNGGLAAIIIMSNAGTGAAEEVNKEILKNNTLLASIEMPSKLFYPAASVSTCIYVLKHGRPHNFKNDKVKFIKFADDGFTRTKRTFKISGNDDPDELYNRVLDLYKNGKKNNEGEHDEEYIEDTIDDSGCDWNYQSHYSIDITPKPEDFYKVIRDYQDFLYHEWKVDVDEAMIRKLRGEGDGTVHPRLDGGTTWPEYVKEVMGYDEYKQLD